MTKEKFLKNFEGDQSMLVSGIYEDIELSKEISYLIFSPVFYPPNVWKKIEALKGYMGIEVVSRGLTAYSEKRMLAYFPKEFQDRLEFPLVYFKIDGRNKFKNLEHKDFLGSIMSLGIKRELLGDIVVEDNVAYGVTTEELYQIIKREVEYIGKVPVEISLIEEQEIPQPKFQEIRESVASPRLDAIIASAVNVSRTAADSFIESGDVMVDYLIEKKGSRTMEEGSVITVRKKGKFLLEKILGENKKGKTVLILKKYI